MCVCVCVSMCLVLMHDCMCEKEKTTSCVLSLCCFCFPLTWEITPSKGPSQLVCIPARGIPALQRMSDVYKISALTA